MMVVFSLIFVADTKIIFGYNFVAPLSKRGGSKKGFTGQAELSLG